MCDDTASTERDSKVPPEALAAALRALTWGTPTAEHHHRDAAAECVRRELGRRGGGWARALGARATGHPELLRDAIQQTMLDAATTRAPYEGRDDVSARAWLKRTFQRELGRMLSGVENARLADADYLAATPARAVTTSGECRELMEILEAEIRRTHGERGRRASNVWATVWLHVEREMGVTVDQQSNRLLRARLRSKGRKVAEATEKDRARAKRAVYNGRNRGKEAARSAASRLLEEGALPLRLQRAARLLRLLD